MTLIINGEKRLLENIATLADALEALGYEGGFFAVAVNHVCVPKAQYPSTPLRERDSVEILSPMQGG